MKRGSAAVLLLLALFVLAACSSLLTSDQPLARVYDLAPYSSPVAAETGGRARLALEVQPIPGLDTDRLLTLDSTGHVSRLAGARWPDYLPEFTASLLQRSLAASGRFRQVSAGPARVANDCLLGLSLQRFHTRLDTRRQPVAVEITMAGSLNCAGQESGIRLEHIETVTGAGIADVVAAHQRAFNSITASLFAQLPSGYVSGTMGVEPGK